MEDYRKLSADMWAPLKKEEKDAEKMERPSLTFFQDGWRRLKANKVAMVSMALILLICLGAVCIPWFWPYTYEEQNLALANIPASMTVYPVDDTENIYVTPQYTIIEVTNAGKLGESVESVRKDMIQKKNYYQMGEKQIVVDYGIYSKAAAEYKKLEKAAEKSGSDMVDISKALYLKDYFKDRPEVKDVSLAEARDILENKMDRIAVSCDDKLLTVKKKIRNTSYVLGTDSLGRDMLIRIVYGARISLTVGIFAAFINFAVGVFYGGIAGYFGGRVDNVMMRIVDVIDSIPTTLYVILIMVVVGPGLSSIIMALGFTFWVKMARIVRGQVLTLKQQEFVKAAIVVGADTKRIMVKHLIPNMMGPIMVNIAMQIPSAIFQEAFLSFVGLGISAPMASWGTLCNDALAGIYVYPYQMVFPAVAISVTILTFNLFSDGLRDAFDPRLRK